MLHFFRKYQKIFFLLTTFIIVMSFVFFGAYQAILPAFSSKKEAPEESYLTQMVRFLNSEQWMMSRNFFAANFLNEGVISKEFLETGIADLIVTCYPERFKKDFE